MADLLPDQYNGVTLYGRACGPLFDAVASQVTTINTCLSPFSSSQLSSSLSLGTPSSSLKHRL